MTDVFKALKYSSPGKAVKKSESTKMFNTEMYDNYMDCLIYNHPRSACERVLLIRGFTPEEVKEFLDYMGR